MIAHPPCQYLANSGVRWLKENPQRQEKMFEACEFFNDLWDADIPKIAVENPIQHKYARTQIEDYTQIIQPHQFGEDASKATCLWLKGLPPLVPTRQFPPRIVDGKPRWSNQTDSGQNNLGPSDTRVTERSRTFKGIAEAMAVQWGK